MKIRFADRLPDGDYALVLPAAGIESEAVRKAGGGLREALARNRFDGEAGSVVEQLIDGRRVLAVGIGKNGKAGDTAEKLGGNAVARLLTSGETVAAIDLSGLSYDADAAAKVALGAVLRAWRYDRYRTKLKDKQKPTLEEVVIVGGGAGAEERYNSRWAAVAEGVALTRELVTEPANIIYPETFVERVQASLKGTGVEIEVLDKAAMEKLGMGALLGVAQGSIREGRLLVLKWNGGKQGEAPVAFVGKGVTFDTGGISIKPAAGMEAMKWDMGGAGAVVGAFKAIAGRKAKANLVAICGLVENTDAEGRLVLADAVTYVQRNYKPSTIIDLATLTGAILISLGHEWAGLFSNDETLAAELTKAGDETGDKLWRMPLAESFDRLIDSPIADIKNVGPREGGSITAAQFIQRFVDDGVKWAHIDMAGKAWSDKASPTSEKGATGFGVRLLDKFVEDTLEG